MQQPGDLLASRDWTRHRNREKRRQWYKMSALVRSPNTEFLETALTNANVNQCSQNDRSKTEADVHTGIAGSRENEIG